VVHCGETVPVQARSMHRTIPGLPRTKSSVTRAAKRKPRHAHACICSCEWERGATFRRPFLRRCRVIVVSLPCYCTACWPATSNDSRTCVMTIASAQGALMAFQVDSRIAGLAREEPRNFRVTDQRRGAQHGGFGCIERSQRATHPDFCGGRAMGSCQPRRMAINRSAKQRTAPLVAATEVGRCSILPSTIRAAPIRAATA
jgi:hypothetical protein